MAERCDVRTPGPLVLDANVSIQIWNNISFIHKLEFLIVNTKSSKIIVNTNGS